MKIQLAGLEVSPHKTFNLAKPIVTQDEFTMGSKIGQNAYLLFETHSSEEMKYLVVVNSKTGESVKIEFKA